MQEITTAQPGPERTLPGKNRTYAYLVFVLTLLALGLSMGQPLPAHAAAITADGTTCTLADAITAANTDTATGGCGAGSGADTITLGADVSLASALPDITTEITIEGAGHTINATATGFSVLKVTSTGNLTLNQATISGGSTPNGGGINNAGTVTVQNSTISNNTANESSVNGLGGGIYNTGTLTVQNSTVSDNETKATESGGVADGGGIYNTGTLTVQNSTLSGNKTGGNGNGGGIYNYDPALGTVTVQNSTLSGNSARTGGGISAINLTLQNSTVVTNSASFRGGGIMTAAPASLQRSLISGNSAPAGGGSEVAIGVRGSLITTNSFNHFGHSSVTNAQAFFGFTPGASDINATSNGTNVALASILNTTLDNNGGPTFTHALVSGSPAIDTISADPPRGRSSNATTAASCQPGVSYDQRGVFRANSPTTSTGTACDIGSFEFGVTPTAVTIANFSSQTSFGSGPRLNWETGSESGLSGFHIWRGSASAAESRLTAALIGAAGGLAGNEYTWQDGAALAWGQRTFYWLEAVEADGSSFTGPVEVVGLGKLFLPTVGR